jgi:hypothetical protein
MKTPLLTAAVLLALAAPAQADAIEDQVTLALEEQGYEILSVDRTWLGRLRIIAESDDLRREIVMNPTTGEVLRDYSLRLVAEQSDLGFEDDDDSPNRTTTTALTDGSSRSLALDPVTSAVEATTDPVGTPLIEKGE